MMQYHYRYVGTNKIKTATIPNADQDMGKLDFSYVASENDREW